MIKISVIIPVYNVEDYIEECLDSIVNQSLDDTEIVVVNDGSTDCTDEMVKKYFLRCKKKKYKYIVQNNSGAGAARNAGIREASGEYIAFMDGDDFYHKNGILEAMYTAAKQNNALICGGDMSFFRNNIYSVGDGRRGTFLEYDGWVKKEDLETANSFYRFIYKTNFLIENNLFFPDYRRNQDNPFFLRCVNKAKNVYFINEETYCYRTGHKNVGWNKKKVLGLVEGVRDELRICLDGKMEKILRNRVLELHSNFSGIAYKFALEEESIEKTLIEINDLLEQAGIDDSQKLLTGNSLKEYMNALELSKAKMFNLIRSCNKRIVFGAGLVGRTIIKLCVEQGIEIDGIIVSNKEYNVDNIFGVPVHSIYEYETEMSSTLVIEAVSSYLKEDIKNLLLSFGYQNIYCVDTELIASIDLEYQENM